MLWIQDKYMMMLAPRLDQHKQKQKGLHNFRCPFCGDSEKDKTKTRGYVYPYKDNLRYKCHNCQCQMSFGKFLETQDTLLSKDFRLEMYKENRTNKVHTYKAVAKVMAPKKKAKTTQNMFGLERVYDLEPEHPAIEYVRERKIPKRAWRRIYFAETFNSVSNHIPKYNATKFGPESRLILPFVDRGDNLTHVQGRAIGPVDKRLRYITLTLDEDAPKVYGMDTIDPKEHIIVVEGPLDSLFLKNAVAMAGASLTPDMFDKTNTTFVYDNEPRNPQIVAQMEKMLQTGYRVCVWGPEYPEGYDINDLVLEGYSTREIQDYILSHSVTGLRAKASMMKFKR